MSNRNQTAFDFDLGSRAINFQRHDRQAAQEDRGQQEDDRRHHRDGHPRFWSERRSSVKDHGLPGEVESILS